jgi:hypothetical protein
MGGSELLTGISLADAARERQLVARLRSPGSDEERLRSIDAVILSQETGLQLRSTLRQLSINDPSPEVRGAARFALVKIQAMAPPSTECVCTQTASSPAKLQQWQPKESVEQVNEGVVDDQVIPTKGPLTKLGEQLGIRRAVREVPDVTVVEMQPADAARITAVATTGSDVAREDQEVVLKAVPIPQAQPRTLPPVEPSPAKELPALSGVLSNIQQKLQQTPASPALAPLTAGERAERQQAEPVAQVPVPTILPAKQPVVASPAIAEPTKAALAAENKLSTIPWPKVPPQATPSPKGDVASTPATKPTVPTPPSPTGAFAVAPLEGPARREGAPSTTVPVRTPAASAITPEPAAVASKPTPAPASITSIQSPTPATPKSVTTLKPASPNPYAGAMGPLGGPEVAPPIATPASRVKPLIDFAEIPEGAAGRQQMAKELLDRGRQLARSGQWSEAESVLFRVRELAVQYRRFHYTPDDLERDISIARQRERLQRADAG